MSYADAFLADIVANPDDDAPRLIYADWLEENGDAARAEFIRVQIEREKPREPGPELWALREREEDLLHKGRNAWLGPIRELVLGTSFRRGFVHTVTMEPASVLEHATELFSLAPVQGLRLISRSMMSPANSPLSEIAALPVFRRLTHLQLQVGVPVEAAATLAGACVALRHLDIDDNLLTPDVLEPFMTAPLAARLESLALGTGIVGRGVVAAVANCPALANLTELRFHLRGHGVSREDMVALMRAANLPRLHSLDLNSTTLDDERIADLSSARLLAQLQHLNLSNTTFGNGGAVGLLARIKGPLLRRLGLSGNDLGPPALEAIAQCQGLPTLLELDLRSNHCSPLATLANTAHLPNLRALYLGKAAIADDDLRVLLRSRLGKQLRWLGLSNNLITDSGASELLSADVGALWRIDLARCRISQAMRDRLSTRLGNRVRIG